MKRALNNSQSYEYHSDSCRGERSKLLRTSSPSQYPADELPRFTCPLYARAPDRLRTARACSGRGFRDISRLKEHIYRCHYKQWSCGRCRESFDSETDLIAHHRKPTQCPLVGDQPGDPISRGIDHAAIRLLRSRKETKSCQDDEDKWYTIWSIIFPGTAPPKSPC
jgi:hypothetical protein